MKIILTIVLFVATIWLFWSLYKCITGIELEVTSNIVSSPGHRATGIEIEGDASAIVVDNKININQRGAVENRIESKVTVKNYKILVRNLTLYLFGSIVSTSFLISFVFNMIKKK